jgi:alkylation response protein AidB-like acyl-CoA dehydrogenase
MSHYKSNVRDIEFNLFEVFRADEMMGQAPYDEMDADTARSVLREIDRLHGRRSPTRSPTATATLRRSTRPRDRHGLAGVRQELPRLDGLRVVRLQLPTAMGGQPAPASLVWATAELVLGANPPCGCTPPVPASPRSVWENGTERDQRIAQHMVDRQWGCTMVLTEPDAGSDVGAGRAKAFLQEDGSWHIEGVKRFITSAEHDMSENIMHLVLARPVGIEGAGGPGTKGLSLFLVPKHHFDLDTGELTGERNGAYVTNLEKKMGIKVSSTCEVTLGDSSIGGGQPARDGCSGEVHDGIAQMFQVIENARMMVGTKAIATLSTGYLNALAYAKERVQGADLTQAATRARPRSRSPTTPTCVAR